MSAAVITTVTGRKRRLPAHVDPTIVVGLDAAGRIVVATPECGGMLFALTLCCDAYDKGVEDGIVCRSCYGVECGDYPTMAEVDVLAPAATVVG